MRDMVIRQPLGCHNVSKGKFLIVALTNPLALLAASLSCQHANTHTHIMIFIGKFELERYT